MKLLGIEPQPDPMEGRGTFICRHSKGDPNCSSTAGGYADQERERARYLESEKREKMDKEEIQRLRKELEGPDNSKYTVVEVEAVGKHLVMKVLYANCQKCSYEGNKVMVFLNTTPTQALFWKIIDPHFREPTKGLTKKNEAPGPAARFPASAEGWQDAINYASSKR